MSFIFRRLFSSASSPANMDAAQKKAQQLIDENAIMVFSKSYCPYCKSTKSTLGSFDAKFATYELNQEADGAEIQSALAGMTGQRTVPNIFIGKVHIGGNSDLEEAVRNGKDGKSFKELLANAGAL